MRVILHDHPRSSNAQKVRFLLGVLGLSYERRPVPFEEPRPEWHYAANPMGGIPVLIDGELVLAESNAILRYLAARQGRDDLLPAAPVERARVDWLLDAVATTLRPACREIDAPAYGFRPHRGIGAEAPQAADVPAAIARMEPQLTAFARLLADGGHACLGRLTLADCAAMPSLWRLQHAGALGHQPRLQAWAEAVAEQPAWTPVAAESGVPN
ncbi:MAG TPA: glutathione S-transferase family protein [Gaiellales bacterium]|nr:glutathione S-transferase family protein [Gaiellales bacterium]